MTAENLSQYVRELPGGQRGRYLTLTARLAQRLGSEGAAVDFRFLPGQPHPSYPDSDEVMWAATTELMLGDAETSDELPLAFLGYHVKTRISGRRESQGFLVTDRRLIVKDDVDGIFGTAVARQYPLYIGPTGIAASAAETATTAASHFDWKGAAALIDPPLAAALTQDLVTVVAVVLEGLGDLGVAPPAAPATATDFRGRVRELGLTGVMKYDDDPKERKHFAKLAKKLPMDAGERVTGALTASTIAGPYGLVITDTGLRSRDLGGAPVVTPRADVDPDLVSLSGPKATQLVVAPGQVHELPSHLTPVQLAAVEQLIQEWARGEISA